MKATQILVALVLILSLAFPAFALDATLAVRRDITPKSPVPTGSVATWPMDAAVPPGWLACNGQAVPASYPELRALMASVPNYNNKQFLRGANSGAGTSVADTTRSHTHGQPAHTHAVSVGGLSVSGTASGQRYVDAHTALKWASHGTSFPTITGTYGPIVRTVGGEGVTSNADTIYAGLDTGNTRTAQSSTVSGSTGWNTFVTGSSGADTTYATGGAETAPMHTLVKYIIKAD